LNNNLYVSVALISLIVEFVPVYNYETQNSPWGNMPSNDRCKLFMGIFDTIFELLDKPKEAAILSKWVQK